MSELVKRLWLLTYEEASYCDTKSYVIRAETEGQAREIAIEDARDAHSGWGGDKPGVHDPRKIEVVEIQERAYPGVVLRADVGS